MTLYIGLSRIYDYELSGDAEDFREDVGFCSQYRYQFCKEEFEEATGLKLAFGEVRKVKSIKIEVE